MREENPSEISKSRGGSKFADQNQPPNKLQNHGRVGFVNASSKLRSALGSHIVKGFSAEKKTKTQTITANSKKQPLAKPDAPNQKNPNSAASNHARVKRSLIGDLSCSVAATQVHPSHGYQSQQQQRRQSSGSRDLFLELDQLRSLLQESKEREFKLQAELSGLQRNGRVLELEGQLETSKNQIDELSQRVGILESG